MPATLPAELCRSKRWQKNSRLTLCVSLLPVVKPRGRYHNALWAALARKACYLLTTFCGFPWMYEATLSTAVCIRRALAERVAHEMCGVT
jgi:hypothetical protein